LRRLVAIDHSFQVFAISLARSISASCDLLSPPQSSTTTTAPRCV
jgi:hypothetical protein